MTCRELNDFLDDYLSGALPWPSRLLFGAHLGRCGHCRAYLDSYRRTIQLGRSLCDDPDGRVPLDVPEDLVQAILAARPRAAASGGGRS